MRCVGPEIRQQEAGAVWHMRTGAPQELRLRAGENKWMTLAMSTAS
jgi:hypothetical protein